MSDTMTILKHPTNRLAKTWLPDGTIKSYDDGKYFVLAERELHDVHGLSRMLTVLEQDAKACVIRGTFKGDAQAAEIDPEHRKGKVRRILDLYDDAPHHWVLVEVDNFEPLSTHPVFDPVSAIDEYIVACLPDPFQGASYHWQLSNSAGHAKNEGKLKAHIWFWLATPYTSAQLKAWASAFKIELDPSVLQTVQIHYTAAPVFDGVDNPVPVRSGFSQGLLGDDVELVIDADLLAAAGSGCGKLSRHQRMLSAAEHDPIAQILDERGSIKRLGPRGELFIECPLAANHTQDSGETSTVYYPAHTGGYENGAFVCQHAHCKDTPQSLFHEALGYNAAEGDFAVIVPAAKPDSETRTPHKTTIPEALHLTTDQANAGRIVSMFSARLMVTADRWFAWVGTHWAQDDGEVYRRAMRLSKLIHLEADRWKAKPAKTAEEKERNEKIAEALKGWAKKSEMRSTIEAALALAKKMLTVPADRIDADPWALNCLNGTVDLRTGQLRPHNPDDYITRITLVNYSPAASATLFESVVAKVTVEEGRTTKPLAAFLQRWFGYCATGSVREQKFAVHHGTGRNGKSTILDAVGEVLGDYAATAAPGLLVSSGRDRHPTEIADLFGRRMVTAHETGDGGVLREDFIKQATGGDRIKARYMRADFFEFSPTHKLQLLTNHKPVIKGQDEGIWRRVLLVPYWARFGSAEEVAAGVATHLRDTRIVERMVAEREGILAWIVAGAVEWFRDGLNPPDTVLAASKDYQTEQDRMLQFVREECELGEEYEAVVGGDFGGLYSAYQNWCKEGGYHALAKNRMIQDLERIVPNYKKELKKTSGGTAKRREVVVICGLRLLCEG